MPHRDNHGLRTDGEANMTERPSMFEGLFTERQKCELCGYVSQLDAIEKHHIVPKELTAEAKMRASATAALCSNCHREVHTWYDKKVFDKVYNTGDKRFRVKTPVEMVKEYQVAYRIFVQYKKEQHKGT